MLSGAIKFVPSQMIPISGMIASNSMVAVGLAYRSLNSQFHDQRQGVLERLALGAGLLDASIAIVREAILTGMSPTIDSAKTVGLVSLPGMMSGLIFAGSIQYGPLGIKLWSRSCSYQRLVWGQSLRAI